MDFRLSEDLVAVRDLAAQILGDLTTSERVAALDGWWDRQAWRSLADAGLLAVALPADAGGSDLGFLAAHVILEQVGLAAAPVPYWESVVLGAMPLSLFGGSERTATLVTRVLAGDAIVTAGLGGDGRSSPGVSVTAAAADGGWELDGTVAGVPLAPLADAILVPAAAPDGGVGVWLVEPGDGVVIRDVEVITGAPYGEVTLDRSAVDGASLLGALDGAVHGWLVRHAAAGLASMTAGACAAAVRLSADYTSRREQFGRPVATFQAVAQRVADAYIDAEGATLTALQAAWRLDEGLPADDEIAIARWWAAEAGHRVLHAAHHVHGGVGVDRDYPLHRYFALVKHNEFLLGGAPAQLLALGAALAAEPAVVE